MQREMSARRGRGAALTAAICIGAAALGTPSAARAVEPDWQPFGWGEAEVVPGAGKVKAGMVMPITVDGGACWGQLDTGALGW